MPTCCSEYIKGELVSVRPMSICLAAIAIAVTGSLLGCVSSTKMSADLFGREIQVHLSDTGRLKINGYTVPFPATRSRLEEAMGPADSTSSKSGSRILYYWTRYGILAREEARSRRINSLYFCYKNCFYMDYVFTGRFRAGDVEIRPVIPYAILRSKGFVDTRKPALTFERLSRNMNVFIMFSYEEEYVVDFVDLIYQEDE